MKLFTLLALHGGVAFCAPVTLNWNIGWVNANPDGRFTRPVIAINGQWPPPVVNVNLGDLITLNIMNNLGNETTSIHIHAMGQKNTPNMEGAVAVSQCPIPPGQSMTMIFSANTTGAHWYHAHGSGQYMDGLRGAFIVHSPSWPFIDAYDVEYTMTLSDWYHDQAPGLINFYQSAKNLALNGGAEPVPDAAIINDVPTAKFNMIPGKRYLFHIINVGAYGTHFVYFDNHNMTVVMMDSVSTIPKVTSQIKLSPAQRYSVIVTASADPSKNYAILSSMDKRSFYPIVTPANLNNNATGFLVYNPAAVLPPQPSIAYSAIDDLTLFPSDKQPLLVDVTQQFIFNFTWGAQEGRYRSFVNGTTFIPPLVPTLFTANNAPPQHVNNSLIYGVNTNPFVLNGPAGVIEILSYNHGDHAHPFHLHGHFPQIIQRGVTTPNIPLGPYPASPMRRDTVIIPAFGFVRMRFTPTNPGIWLFHCHNEWHTEAGMTVTFIEDPPRIQALKLSPPPGNLQNCATLNIPVMGNAAGRGTLGGNPADWLKLDGAKVKPEMNPQGALLKKVV